MAGCPSVAPRSGKGVCLEETDEIPLLGDLGKIILLHYFTSLYNKVNYFVSPSKVGLKQKN